MRSDDLAVTEDRLSRTSALMGQRWTVPRPGWRAPLALGMALALGAAVTQAAEPVFGGNFIGVDQLPSGVQGGPNEINHVPGPDGGSSQALVIDFGEDVLNVEAEFGAFRTSEGGNGCAEVGRWTAFSALGIQLSAKTFEAGDDVPTVIATETPLRYLAFNAEPYANGCGSTTGTPDSSDFTITGLKFVFALDEHVEFGIPDNGSVEPLSEDDFFAYDPDEPFVDDNGNLVDPDGARLGTIVIEPGNCDGDTDAGSATECNIELVDERFTSTFERAGDIQGTLAVRAIKTIDDNRGNCTNPGSFNDTGKLYLNRELNVVPDESDAVIIVPSYLCGIPVDGTPQFTVIELESSLTVRESVITHTVADPDPDFDSFKCESDFRNKQPVIGWLPRDGEIPVIGPDRMPSRTMEDVTTGCGSTRGTTFRMSYLLFDLRHLPGTDYASVVAGEFEQLLTTFSQFAACVNNGTLTSTIESSVDKAARWFGDGRLDKASGELTKLRSEVEDYNSWLGRDLPRCFWNEDGGVVIAADPEVEMPDDGIEPRNARGDLLTQIDHILYMIESKFDDVQAPDDGSEVPQSQGKAKSNAKNRKK